MNTTLAAVRSRSHLLALRARMRSHALLFVWCARQGFAAEALDSLHYAKLYRDLGHHLYPNANVTQAFPRGRWN